MRSPHSVILPVHQTMASSTRRFRHPAIRAAACSRGPLRSHPFGTGSVALPPADAGSLTATVTPGPRSTARRSCRIARWFAIGGSLRSRLRWFLLVPVPIEFGGTSPANDWSKRWALRGERDRSPLSPVGGISLSPSVPSPSRGRGNGGWPRGRKTKTPGLSPDADPTLFPSRLTAFFHEFCLSFIQAFLQAVYKAVLKYCTPSFKQPA
jgi:hypothetical protein